MMMAEENILGKIWDKLKSDFMIGYNWGRGNSKKKASPPQPPTPAPKEEPKQNTEKPQASTGEPSSGGTAKKKIKKFKDSKKKEQRSMKDRGCKPAPKAKGKTRCPKPGGGFTYYDSKAAMGKFKKKGK